MDPIIAIGLFDNPWVVAVVVVGGALVNWLSQRRQARQQQEHRTEEDAPPSPKKSQGEFDMEEALRRLLGEEVPSPSPAPPPIPRVPRDQRPPGPAAWQSGSKSQPVRTWIEDSDVTTARTAPVLTPPPIAVARPMAVSVEVGQSSEQATVRFEQLNEQGRHPATVIDHGHTRRTRTGTKSTLWRDRKSVRRAFVASLVVGPPKGLES